MQPIELQQEVVSKINRLLSYAIDKQIISQCDAATCFCAIACQTKEPLTIRCGFTYQEENDLNFKEAINLGLELDKMTIDCLTLTHIISNIIQPLRAVAC